MRRLFFLVIMLFITCLSTVYAERTFYVSLSGNDNNAGTQRAPWRSLYYARDYIADLYDGGLAENITVMLAAGVYELTEPLVFTPFDLGPEGVRVTWVAEPGGKVVISGGRRIEDWKRIGDGLWSAKLPDEGINWYPEFLAVNGRQAIRARYPNVDATVPGVLVTQSTLDVENKALHLQFDPETLKDWKNLPDIEFVALGNWAINRMRLQSVNAAGNTATVMAPALDRSQLYWNWPDAGRWGFFENAREFLDQPGEWYLDRKTKTIYYRPLPDEEMTKASVVAPYLESLLELKGTAEKPVRNLHFQGIQFMYANWPLPAGDYHGVQACHYGTNMQAEWQVVPAAVNWEYATDCSLTNGGISFTGQGGLNLGTQCYNNRFENNLLENIGANGIMCGAENDDALAPAGNVIKNNIVRKCGARFFGAVGIWVGFARDTVISHNDVYDLPYSGISVGWVWAPILSACRGTLVEYNHIHDVMKMLADGGGIYTLGWQPGMVIRGNVIHDVKVGPFRQGAPNNGMFIDEGSKEFLFKDNVIWSAGEGAVRHNQNSHDWHTWVNNEFDLQIYAPGKFGTALSSPTSLEAPHSEALEPDQFTIDAWVNVQVTGPSGDPRRWVLCKNFNEWTNGNYALVVNEKQAGAYMNIGGGSENMIEAFSEDDVLVPGQWQYLAMTFDGMQLAMYVDGKLVAKTEVNQPRSKAENPLTIGRRQDNYLGFDGLIDEVRIYNRALSAEELLTIYKAGNAEAPQLAPVPDDGSLVGQWSFEDRDNMQLIIDRALRRAGIEKRTN